MIPLIAPSLQPRHALHEKFEYPLRILALHQLEILLVVEPIV